MKFGEAQNTNVDAVSLRPLISLALVGGCRAVELLKFMAQSLAVRLL